MYDLFNQYNIEHKIKLNRLKEIIKEIEVISNKIGYWEGNMIGCYSACSNAWKANLIKPGDPKERVVLMYKLSKLKIEAANIIGEI